MNTGNYHKRIGKYRMTVIERSYETYEGLSRGKESMICDMETQKVLLLEGYDLSYEFDKSKRDEDVLELIEKLDKEK